jgi:hypothetical protein
MSGTFCQPLAYVLLTLLLTSILPVPISQNLKFASFLSTPWYVPKQDVVYLADVSVSAVDGKICR